MTSQLATIHDQTPSRGVDTQSLVFDPDIINNMMRMGEMMAKATITVPKHLAGNPADCLAIVLQAAQWRMNPFAVAQKTHLVNGQLGYEAQLVNAVIQNSGAIRGRFHYEYRGEGQAIECRVGAIIAGESNVTWGEWLSAAQVTTKNSPLWKTNPKQQLGYLQVKNWARQYTPGAILGVYSVDELRDSDPLDMGTATRVDEPAPKRTEGVKAKLAARKAAAEPPAPTLADVLAAIDAATDLATLKSVPAAQLADDGDKAEARKAYKSRAAAIKSAAEAPPLELEPSTMLDSLIAAARTTHGEEQRAEILDAARDLSEAERDQIVAAFPADGE